MTNPKRLSELCKGNKAFDEQIKRIVLGGSFDGFNSSVGRAYQARENGQWVHTPPETKK